MTESSEDRENKDCFPPPHSSKEWLTCLSIGFSAGVAATLTILRLVCSACRKS